MYAAVMDDGIYIITNYLDEMEYELGELDEASDIVVEEWKINAGGWYRVAQADYYVHEGRVGINE